MVPFVREPSFVRYLTYVKLHRITTFHKKETAFHGSSFFVHTAGYLRRIFSAICRYSFRVMTPLSSRYLFQYWRWRYFVIVSFVGVFTLHPPITVIVTAFPLDHSTGIRVFLCSGGQYIIENPNFTANFHEQETGSHSVANDCP